MTKEMIVEEMKELVQKKEWIPHYMKKIAFNGIQLSGMRAMSDCNIKNNDELKLTQRLLGCIPEVKGQMRQTKQMERELRLSGGMAMSMDNTAGADGGGGDVEEEEEIAPIAKFQKDEHSKEKRKK
ncbi:uncharacterized protein MONOS_8471 [Monocercomonoides exilis]|uniref:uncharacterized protein n=1 Tax=Monocercomonoides exilis TaxID=2049356 RepID=UPI003559FC6B|nr:hypothetical protein MONOS_8471 [Monocercomonoides exilis]|eukprot:MONOS_8471.1-p1 / transcript=MONOS_8471.1 / gene=MONOS_8471 / organism=Monocercomonoides_exilis_PA203 / gene_product=unspecified product / transcript_product=unspecified product / location=Mono_scaffold00320:35449-36032(-) / protein_length=125 / sequence_SO=supercontig / SO=protein_coding / is_pseudo=false